MAAKRKKKAAAGAAKHREDVEIVRANVNREIVRSDAFASMYVNDTQIQTSPWDLRLILGVIDQPRLKDGGLVRVKEVGEVRMSPQHAKAVTRILIKQLVTYEERFGPIPLPESDSE